MPHSIDGIAASESGSDGLESSGQPPLSVMSTVPPQVGAAGAMPPLAEALQSTAVPRVGPARSRAGVGLCDLPMDIWEHLFRRSGLSIVQLVRLSMVCRTLRNVARRYAVIAHACAYLHSCVIGSPRIAQCRAHEHDRFIVTALTQCIAQNHHQFGHTSTAAIYNSPPLIMHTPTTTMHAA